MLPELRPLLQDVFDQAEPGTEWVISRYRDAGCKLRTQLQRIIRKAGVNPWPRLWHNLRSSRQTELAENYPIHVVCQWIGNSAAIAQEHYLQVTDAHFVRALGVSQIPAQVGVGSSGMESGQSRKSAENRGYPTPSHHTTHVVVTPTGFEPVSRP
jgi:hypothetical protein